MLTIYSLWRRDIVRFFRQRSRILGALATPVLFWFVLGSGLGQSFRVGPEGVIQGGYLEYYFPGTLALIVLFTAVFSTISIVEDRQEGFLQGVLASPAARLSIVLGKVLGSTTIAAINAGVFLLLAPLAGVPLSPGGAAAAAVFVVLVGVALSGLGVLIAWLLQSTQGFHAIMNLLLVPMWLLSGAVFPAEGAAGWVRIVMTVNPLTYGVEGLRAALYGGSLAGLGEPALVVGLFGALTIVLATLAAHGRPGATP